MVEGDLAQRVQSILEPVVGPGGVVAHVRAEMDFTRRETTEERFDPEGQVARSEQISKETSSDASGGTGGVAGVASNAPGAPGGVASSPSGASTSERSSETTNYEITKTTTRQVAPQGEIRRLHVAVLVDGKPGEDGSVAPFEEAELKRFEELAKHAVGCSGERGDQITVTSVPFRTVDVAAEGGWFDPSIFALLGSLLRGAAMVVAVLLFARLVVAPLLAAARAAQAGAVLPGSAGVSIAVGDEGAVALPAGAAAAPLPLPPEQATLSDRVGQLARQRSDDSVRTIRGWLNQR
jgi:flagellar M-ring protein FliF